MRPIYLLLFVLFTLNACKSKKTTPFIDWTYLGSSHSTNLVNVDPSAKHMYATDGGSSINIFTTKFLIGEYNADIDHIINGGIVGFTVNDTIYADTSIGGKIYITADNNDKIDGNFALATISGNTIIGSFKNVPRN